MGSRPADASTCVVDTWGDGSGVGCGSPALVGGGGQRSMANGLCPLSVNGVAYSAHGTHGTPETDMGRSVLGQSDLGKEVIRAPVRSSECRPDRFDSVILYSL